MQLKQNLIHCLIAAFFIIALIYYVIGDKLIVREGFGGLDRCPNVLIQKDKDFFLFNTKVAKVPGVNPLQFSSLEDYKEFMDWQRGQVLKCPVLYVQQGLDVQGNQVYQQRPDPFDPQGGLGAMPAAPGPIDVSDVSLLFDAGRDDPPYNQNTYPSYDPDNQYIGIHTPLDQMNVEAQREEYSGNAMDSNWGGAAYTQQLVHDGYYAQDEVYKVTH